MGNKDKAVTLTPPGVLLPAIVPRVGRMNTASGVMREMSKIYREARTGKIDLADASRLTYILQSIGRLFETTELEKRMDALERARWPE